MTASPQELERLQQEWREAAIACQAIDESRAPGRRAALRDARERVKVAARAYRAYLKLVKGLLP